MDTTTTSELNNTSTGNAGTSGNSGTSLPHSITSKLVHFSDYDEVSTIEPITSRQHYRHLPLCNINCSKRILPVTHWLPKYEWKHNLLHDLIAGLTVAVMHVPQGLAYALLSHVPPIVGVYMGTYPVVIYFLFGNSRHLSVGTFAPLAIMTGAIVQKYNCSDPHTQPSLDGCELHIASTVALWVGFWHVAAYILRLGFFATILSKTLVSAFTAGAGFHILLSQIPDFFGIHIETDTGMFRLITSSISIGKKIPSTNILALIISITTCLILLINKLFINQRLEHKIHFALPIELIVIGIGIIVTKYCKLHDTYSVPIIGEIPQGLQSPKLAFYTPLDHIYVDSILIALVSYAIATSVAFHLAAQGSYEIDPNQEFLALGLANIVGSFFLCIPIGGSMTRSIVQYKSGGQSQLTGLFCAVILIAIILWIGPIFEKLPKSILAGIIVMTLYPVVSQLIEFPSIWKLSKQDGILWLSTFLSVIIFDIAIGLAIGVLVAFLFIYYHSTTPYVCALGRITLARESQTRENDHMFIDLRHSQACEIPGVRIIQISSSLHFANRAYVKAKIQDLAEVSPEHVLKQQQRMIKAKESEEEITEKLNEMKTVEWRMHTNTSARPSTSRRPSIHSYLQTKHILQYIILELSLVQEVDQAAIVALQNLMQLYRDIQIQMVVTSKNPKFISHLYCFPNIRTAIRELMRVKHLGIIST